MSACPKASGEESQFSKSNRSTEQTARILERKAVTIHFYYQLIYLINRLVYRLAIKCQKCLNLFEHNSSTLQCNMRERTGNPHERLTFENIWLRFTIIAREILL